MTRKPRTARTRHGEEVYVGTTWSIEGGWEGYVIGPQGFAVLVFIPGE